MPVVCERARTPRSADRIALSVMIASISAVPGSPVSASVAPRCRPRQADARSTAATSNSTYQPRYRADGDPIGAIARESAAGRCAQCPSFKRLSFGMPRDDAPCGAATPFSWDRRQSRRGPCRPRASLAWETTNHLRKQGSSSPEVAIVTKTSRDRGEWWVRRGSNPGPLD